MAAATTDAAWHAAVEAGSAEGVGAGSRACFGNTYTSTALMAGCTADGSDSEPNSVVSMASGGCGDGGSESNIEKIILSGGEDAEAGVERAGGDDDDGRQAVDDDGGEVEEEEGEEDDCDGGCDLGWGAEKQRVKEL